jgi:hypothetical protein
MKPKEFYLHVDLWKDSCWLVWPVNRKQAEAWYSKKFPEDSELLPQLDGNAALSIMGKNNIIFLSKWDTDAECFGYLIHECIHIANYILASCGVKEAEGKDEALAYTADFLMRHFTAALTETI